VSDFDDYDADYDIDNGWYARSQVEEASERKWFAGKYGLTPAETTRLLAVCRIDLLEKELEDWRASHGYPAYNSPLVRGILNDLVTSGRFK
jgi:hypothetical protein